MRRILLHFFFGAIVFFSFCGKLFAHDSCFLDQMGIDSIILLTSETH